MKTTCKSVLTFLLPLLLLASGAFAQEANRRILFRTLGWNAAYEMLYLPGGAKEQPCRVPMRSLSPFYVHRGGSTLEFYAEPLQERDGRDPKEEKPAPLVSVTIPRTIDEALLLFTNSGTEARPVIGVRVIDDSLRAFPLMTAKAINFTGMPIEAVLLNVGKKVDPGASVLWKIPVPPSVRTRITLSAPSKGGWKPFLNQTLDLMAGHRIYLFLHEAHEIAVDTTTENGAATRMILKPEDRPRPLAGDLGQVRSQPTPR